MKYRVIVRSNCPSPLHEDLVCEVTANNRMEAVYQAQKHWHTIYPECDWDSMFEVVSVQPCETHTQTQGPANDRS